MKSETPEHKVTTEGIQIEEGIVCHVDTSDFNVGDELVLSIVNEGMLVVKKSAL